MWTGSPRAAARALMASTAVLWGMTVTPVLGFVSGATTATLAATLTRGNRRRDGRYSSRPGITDSGSSGLRVTTGSLADAAEGTPVIRVLSAAGGTPPYNWSLTGGSLPAGLSLSRAGTITGMASGTGSSDFTVTVTDSDSQTGRASLSLTAISAPFSPSSPSTSGGVATWHITSAINGGDPETVRVLVPDAPSPGYPHGLAITLPVWAGSHNTKNGNGLDTIQSLGLHNAYNLTVVELSSSVSPWYADNPDNSACLQESYVLQGVAWAKSQYGITGEERVWLLGFSKSGNGGQQLMYRWPGTFAGVASWDFPGMMTSYDGTDPSYGGKVRGGSADVYGTQDSYAANYELSPANLSSWQAASDFGTVNRVWIGGWKIFKADVEAYHSALATAGISHSYARVSASSHTWSPTRQWLPVALAALLGPPRA